MAHQQQHAARRTALEAALQQQQHGDDVDTLETLDELIDIHMQSRDLRTAVHYAQRRHGIVARHTDELDLVESSFQLCTIYCRAAANHGFSASEVRAFLTHAASLVEHADSICCTASTNGGQPTLRMTQVRCLAADVMFQSDGDLRGYLDTCDGHLQLLPPPPGAGHEEAPSSSASWSAAEVVNAQLQIVADIQMEMATKVSRSLFTS